MNIIWFLLIIVSIIFAFITGRIEDFTKAMFDAGKASIEVSLYLLGIVSIWLGVTKILEDAGFVEKIAVYFRPIISKLFKNIPANHPSISSITLNMLANIFGLGNAATPMGIKAMQELQTLNSNEDKEEITFEMMLFIIINTASIQIIPFTVIGILASLGSANPTWIVLPTIVATVISALFAICIFYIFRKFAK